MWVVGVNEMWSGEEKVSDVGECINTYHLTPNTSPHHLNSRASSPVPNKL